MILSKNRIENVDIDFEINEKITGGRLNELLLIVPTNRKIRSLKKEIISFSKEQSAGTINLDTIGSFSTKLLSAKGQGTLLLSEAAAAVLLRQSFNESILNYFSYYKKEIPHGTLSRVKNVISEYKRHGISPANLKAEAERLEGSERIKALDIAAIYEKYQDKCSKTGYYETGDVYKQLTSTGSDKFGSAFRELYPDVNLIVVMGFDEFTTPEIEILSMAADTPGIKLFLSFDYYMYNPLIFSHLDNCYNRLMGKGFISIEEKTPAGKTEFKSVLRKNLFNELHREHYDSYKQQLTKITAGNRQKEIELIAKEIKGLIVHNKVNPGDIGVVFNLISGYSPFIRDIFNLYGIPFNLTDRHPLNTSQPVISIINFLEILENDFYYKNIFRAFSGGFIKLKGVDISNLLKASVKLKIISGYEQWRLRLKNSLNNTSDDENEGAKNSEKNIFRKALEDIESIHKALAPFKRKLTLSQFRQEVEKLVYFLEIPSVIINNYSAETEENIKAVTTFLETVNELLDLFEPEFGASEKFPLKFFLLNIRTAVNSTRYNIKEKPGYGVQVTTMNELRGLKFDYLFISGLTDGDFPTRFSPEIFFSGSYAKNELKHHIEERYLFYQSLCSWSKKLYLTHPLNDESKELSESNFLANFSKLFSISSKSEKDFDGCIYAREELLAEIGKEGVDKISCYPSVSEEIIPSEIEKSIMIEKLRDTGNSLSEYTGFIDGEKNAEIYEKLSGLKRRQFSISQLETYAKCPFKFFIERVLGIEAPEEPSEEIEAMEMGSLLHDILYRFYKSLTDKGIILQSCSDKEFKIAEDLIYEAAASALEEAGFNAASVFYEKEKIMGLHGNRKNSILYKFLMIEREETDGFIPSFFEKGFGNIDDESGRIPVHIKAGDIFVRGKIDRIDINKPEKTFKVVDYKSGKNTLTTGKFEEGISLQLPLYMYAAKELIKQELNEDYKAAGAEIFSLKYSKTYFGKKKAGFPSSPEGKDKNENVIDLCIELVNKYVEGISSGKFNLSELQNREKEVCSLCDFQGICRLQASN